MDRFGGLVRWPPEAGGRRPRCSIRRWPWPVLPTAPTRWGALGDQSPCTTMHIPHAQQAWQEACARQCTRAKELGGAGRDDSSSIVAPSSGRSEAAFELALDVHKRKAAGAAPAAGQQARWVSKATVARRQQRRQQTDQRKSIAPGTPAFGTSVPALRCACRPCYACRESPVPCGAECGELTLAPSVCACPGPA